jgi:para-nitrobenzyl esterase
VTTPAGLGGTEITLGAGTISGLSGPLGSALLGIPYAHATRLRPPTPADLPQALQAVAFGPAAPQPRRPLGDSVFGPPAAQAEQCLSLNVWRPAIADDGLPVFVYIHGGGFVVGRSGCAALDGARLADAMGAVVVTLNYRLGSAGWCAHPALAEQPGAPAGNWGLLDQVAALEWVAENIAAFGADPARVTLAGQSAGALSLVDLLAAPTSAGLIARAVVQSPPMADATVPAELTERWALALSAEATGGTGFDADALRALSAEELCALHERTLARPEFRGTRGGALPTLDPGSLPYAPRDQPAASPSVDVLLGTTADEGTFFSEIAAPPGAWSEQDLRARVAHLPGIDEVRADELIAGARALPGADAIAPRALFGPIATDALVVGPALAWGRSRAAADASVHRYRIEHPSPQPGLGATHSIDVPLMFKSYVDDPVSRALCGADAAAEAASEALIEMLSGFVHGETPPWPALGIDAGEESLALIGGSLPWRIDTEPAKAA